MLPISASPSPCAHRAAIETQGCSTGSGGCGLWLWCPGRRWSEGDHGIVARRRQARQERAVGGFRHRPLPEHPVRPVELGLRSGQRGGLRLEGAVRPVGQPPSAPVRDEAQRSVPAPAGLADRLVGTTADRQRGPRGPEDVMRMGVGVAGVARERQDKKHRGVPRHVRVVPGDDGQPIARRMRDRRPEEIVPLEHDGRTRLRGARRQGDHTAHRPGRSLAVDLAHGQHPVAVRRGAQPAMVVRLACRRSRCQGHRVAGGGSVAQPHTLVRLVHIGDGPGGPSRHHAQGTAAVLVDAAANADPLRRVIREAPCIGAHRHGAPSIGWA